MRKSVLAGMLVYVLSMGWVNAQAPVIITETQSFFPVGGTQVLFLEDKTHQISLDAFRLISDAKLQPASREYVNFGITTSAFWLKFKLLNQTGKPVFLRIMNPSLDTARLSVFVGKKLLVEKNVLSSKPEVYLPNTPFSLPTSTDTLTCYLRVFAKVPCVVAMYVLPEKHMAKVIFDQAIPDLLFFGAVLIMILYNLFIGIATRSSVYFYYIAYSFAVGLATFFFKAYPIAILGKHHGIINDNFAVVGSMMPICLSLFTIEFLQIKQRYLLGYRLLWTSMILHTWAILVFLLGFVELNVALYQPFSIFSNVVVILVSLRLYKTYRPARIFFYAFLSYVVLSSGVVLMFLNITPITLFTFYFLHIGASTELTLFSIALADKINLYRKEKEDAQRKTIEVIKEQNAMLEQKVTERTHQLQQANEELNTTLELVETERQKSDALLLNILPTETAQELKEKGHATPKYYELITVLFTDFKGFTNIAEKISPAEVIENLNTCFLAFDEICDKYGLEKIKTIGDACMCAGGLPVANTTNPIDVVQAGLEMQQWMQNWIISKQAQGQPVWELRLGIHSGEAVAGVVGKNKFAYDIWGDTVNLASRMESSGEVGKVNISGATYELVKDNFKCVFRGKVQAKNKGETEMYFVEGIL
jgi:class 3 adenylate cyclase